MNANIQVLLSDDERQEVECWTRVMGYFRPVSHFNKGKKSEYAERVWFNENKAMVSAQKLSCAAGAK